MSPPPPLVQLPDSFITVEDADEEVFFIYTDLNASSGPDEATVVHRGLGFINPNQDMINIQVELVAPSLPTVETSGRKRGRSKNVMSGTTRILDVDLHQDTTALRSRPGDTGSVLWQASVDLARFLLGPRAIASQTESLLNPAILSQSHIMELGAGTGLLPIVMADLVSRYTVTDIEDVLPLIRKNLLSNAPGWATDGKISVEPCDWIHLHNMPIPSRSRYFGAENAIDLLLVVDCIYNPALVAPLISTINHFTAIDKTVVMVFVELRSDEVIRDFLDAWLSSGSWCIKRVVDPNLHRRYALWLGWKDTTSLLE